MIVEKTQGEPEASEMAQKPVVHPIEQIPAYSGGWELFVRPKQKGPPLHSKHNVLIVRVRPGTEPGDRRTGVDPRDGIPL